MRAGDVPHWLEFQRRTEELVELQLALDLSTGSNVTGWRPRGRSPSARIARCRCT
jgi:hypothetical protein